MAGQGAWKAEPRKDAVVETGHGGDPVAGKGEDDKPDPVPDAVGGRAVTTW
ncbi:hypothetical protein [Kribbella deserti]|uniref:Uncharacterized protein n=1 Tax=Kribbella deserti TaxID=1926257 RepID=A0ABV6QFC2_9ACTN